MTPPQLSSTSSSSTTTSNSSRRSIQSLLTLVLFISMIITNFITITEATKQQSPFDPSKCILHTSGGTIDLNKLKKSDYYSTSSDYEYFVNICGASKTCGGEEWASVFEESSQPSNCGGLGKLNQIELALADEKDLSKGVILNYYGGTIPGGQSIPLATEVQITCSTEKDEPRLMFKTRKNEERKGVMTEVFYFSIASPDGCPFSGQSFWRYDAVGPIVLTILCVGIAAYFVIGVVIMKFKFKKTGIEIIPNVHLWIGLVMLVKDGMLLIVDGVKALVNKIKNRGSYQEISGPSA